MTWMKQVALSGKDEKFIQNFAMKARREETT
jgi:hypothetical protein